jgi:hypothetical protein
MPHLAHAPARSLQLYASATLVALGLGAGGCVGKITAGSADPDPTPPADGRGGAAAARGGPQGPDGAGGAPMPADPRACRSGPRRIWKLTPSQYTRSVQAVLPGALRAGDAIAASLVAGEGFSNDSGALALTAPHVTQVLASAWRLAGEATADPRTLDPCLADGPDAACLREVVTRYVGKAFRRDLSLAEVDALTAFVQRQIAASDLRAGLQQLFIYVFSSPSFLFRTELGPEPADGTAPVPLTPFEKASALSYFLTDGPPDAELLAAARSGGLATKAAIEAQARRLLGRPETAAGLRAFLGEHLRLDDIAAVKKDASVFPGWNEALAAELAREAQGLVRQVVWGEGARLSTLLAADFTMANASLAAFYGLPAGGLDRTELRKVRWKAGERAGIFTQAGLMALAASDNDTAPIRRALFVRERLLCQPVPDPPPDINAVPPQPDGKRTQRERLATHSADPTCAACHAQMDPIGLAFEIYDGIGRHRTTDVGQPIESAGRLSMVEGEPAFASGVELMQRLAGLPEAGRCVVAKAFRYAHGRADEPSDACALDRLSQAFDAAGGDMVALAVAITADESFFVRH